MAKEPVKKTSMGMEENIEGLLSYLFGFISGLIFYFGETTSKTVRFHALQSIALTVVIIILQILLGIIFAILINVLPLGMLWLISILSFLIWLAVLALWIFLMVSAYQNKKFKLPIIGDFCEKTANK